MQKGKNDCEIEHNIPGGELVLVLMLVIESKIRNQRSEVGGQKRGAARPQNHGHRRTELRDQGISDW